jgi:hypothetical protein
MNGLNPKTEALAKERQARIQQEVQHAALARQVKSQRHPSAGLRYHQVLSFGVGRFTGRLSVTVSMRWSPGAAR